MLEVPGAPSAWSSRWDVLPATLSSLLDATGPAGRTALWRARWKLLVLTGPEASSANKSEAPELDFILYHVA